MAKKKDYYKTRNFRLTKLPGEHCKPQGGVFKGEDNLVKARTKESIIREAVYKHARQKVEDQERERRKIYEDRMKERERKMRINSYKLNNEE